MLRISRIVVGVDGSEVSAKALRWALREAKLRKARVEVFHCWSLTPMIDPTGYGTYVPIDELSATANTLMERTMQQVASEIGELDVKTSVVRGSPSATLLEVSKEAEMIVVGRRGHGGFLGLLIGSVAEQVAHHASCPAVIVPG